MGNLIITTEIICDLPKEVLEKYNIKVCPVNYFVDGYEYNTETNLMPASQFYANMRSGAEVKTTQVNQNEACSFLTKYVKSGNNVLHLSFSSGLSGTYNSFVYAAKEINTKSEKKVYVIDSLCAAAGHGLFVLLVAKKAQENNMTLEKLINYANEIKLKIQHIFTVDNLKYLVKGGRVSKINAKLANLLQIKPLMKVDTDGKLVVTNKIFGRKLVIKKMFEIMTKSYNPHFANIFICHADCKGDAQKLSKMILDYYGIESTIVSLNYFIGGHSGPGTLSLFYVGEKR